MLYYTHICFNTGVHPKQSTNIKGNIWHNYGYSSITEKSYLNQRIPVAENRIIAKLQLRILATVGLQLNVAHGLEPNIFFTRVFVCGFPF